MSNHCDHFLFPTEFLDSLHLSNLPPPNSELKEQTIIILLSNLNVVSNLMNGARFVIQNMLDCSLDLETKTGRRTRQQILLPKIDLSI